jgi:hypothetical protein
MIVVNIPLAFNFRAVVYLSLLISSKHIVGAEVQLNTFLTSALGGGEWLPSHTSCCTPGEKMLRTQSIDSW